MAKIILATTLMLIKLEFILSEAETWVHIGM